MKPLPQNTTQHTPPQLTQQVAPPLQYLPMPQDTFNWNSSRLVY